MIYTFDYDNAYSSGPALSIVEFDLKAIGSETAVRVNALVDSGADATIIPLTYLEQANVEQVGRARMRWGTHLSGSYDVYLATIQIGSHTFFGVRVLGDKQGEEAILGRDVLNQMKVILNGPAQVVEIPVE
ncbi:MAG: hypothetical protein GY805_22450 [Chloroflexi bacterium]|nr:hypothetical protein [Chloroflexota bacterium]